MNKTIKRLLSIVSYGISYITTALMFGIVFIVLFLLSGGMRAMYVVSDSMVPTFSKGDLLVTSSTSFNTVDVGDVVAYEAEWFNDKLVTHRIVDITNGEVTVKGDANLVPDPVFNKNKIYGEVVAVYPYVGLLINPVGILMLAGVALIFSIIADLLKVKPRRAHQTTNDIQSLFSQTKNVSPRRAIVDTVKVKEISPFSREYNETT